MNDSSVARLEERSRVLFAESVENLDMRTRSRLNQARQAALAAAARRRRFVGVRWWAPAAGFSAAALLGVALWFGPQSAHLGVAPIDRPPVAADTQSSLEDLDIVASSTEEMDLLQDDVEFYDWANQVAGTEAGGASAESGSVG